MVVSVKAASILGVIVFDDTVFSITRYGCLQIFLLSS